MGREVVKAVHNDPDLTLVGGIDPTKAGEDVGSVAGIEQLGIKMNASIDEVLDTNKPDVIVDFTNPAVIYENAKKNVIRWYSCSHRYYRIDRRTT